MNLLELQRRMFEDVRRPLTSDFAMQQKTEDGQSIPTVFCIRALNPLPESRKILETSRASP